MCIRILSLFIAFATLLQNVDAAPVFEPTFEQIAVEQGLSNYNVGNVSQDSLGYLWIATSRGLNRYDGQTFTPFFFDPENSEQGIPNDMIFQVLCSHNHVFALTLSGTVVYNQLTQQWQLLTAKRYITDMVEYNGEVLMIFKQKIHRYDFEQRKLILCPEFKDVKVQRFTGSNDDLLWFIAVGFRQLYAYDATYQLHHSLRFAVGDIRQVPFVFNGRIIAKGNKGIAEYAIEGKKVQQLPSALFNTIGSTAAVSTFQNINDTHLLIATMGDGLYVYNPKEKLLKHIHSGDGVASLSCNFIKNVFVDKDDHVWISTFNKGLNVYYNEQNRFNPSRDLNLKTQDNFINCIVYDSYYDDLLFGTRMNGILSRKDDIDNKINQKIKDHGLGTVISLFEDSEKKLWIGSVDEIAVLDSKRDRLVQIEKAHQLTHIENITEKEGEIYLASELGSIKVYSLSGKYLHTIMPHLYGVNQVLHTPDSSYFCSFRTGLYSFNRKTKQTRHLELKKDGKAFAWEGAVCLLQEDASTLWIGTLSWGLIKVDLKTLECESFTRKDGLPGNDVTAIQMDDYGQLWLSTSDGLSCMHDDGQFCNFSAHEGVDNYQFHRRSTLQTDDGFIYFGGNNGLSYFNPSEIVFNKVLTGQVVLESFSSNGKEIKPGGKKEILSRSLPYTDNIVLPYHYSNFSITYTLPEVYAHDEINYAYKLEGWDEEWRETSGAHTVYYTNLPAGNYAFKVKASRRSSLWTTPTAIDIELKRAPWFRWWAFVIYALFIITILVVIFVLTLHRRTAQEKLRAEQNEHKRENQVNEMKHRFFTNISHELRTPLTIIHAISNISITELDTEEKTFHFLRNLRLNTERLKRLVDQLLTFRNLEIDTLTVDVSLQHVSRVIERVVEPFQLFTQQKKIEFVSTCQLSKEEYTIDRDKLEKVLNNLLDNALKYTSPGGRVDLKVSEISHEEALGQAWELTSLEFKPKTYLYGEVCDTGIGIEEEALGHIFDRYYKASSNVDYSGTGIGLNFVKRLIDLQNGQIRAKSKVGQGTCFSFIIPIQESCGDEADTLELHYGETLDKSDFIKVDIPEAFHGKTLLIVEDDVSLNNYLVKSYENDFKVYSAYDSHEGRILAKNTFPDLIISDVMMREADEGLKFCESIKKDPYISHIPVVLLTARTQKNEIQEGYAYGADAYVTKPFDIQILSSHIVSILENRERLQKEMFTAELPKKDENESYNQNDIVFIKKINEIIQEQFQRSDFNITSLSKDLLISRSAFYKKFTQVTQLSPNDYLRRYRIKKAEELMKTNKYSITQIVEMVGFSSRSGFYTSFKKENGMTPSDYIKTLKN